MAGIGYHDNGGIGVLGHEHLLAYWTSDVDLFSWLDVACEEQSGRCLIVTLELELRLKYRLTISNTIPKEWSQKPSAYHVLQSWKM